MAHKKHKSKLAGIHQAETSAKNTAKASFNAGQQPLMSVKHNLQNDADEATAIDRSRKRRKFNSNTGLDHHNPPSFDIPETIMIEDTERLGLESDASAQKLPTEVRHLSSKYQFTTMSILSSAKISDKVKNLLLRVENFSFADPKSKPGIVILYAKSEVASKMVSIVEIARQDIERDKGKWWQYSKVDAQIAEVRIKAVKRRNDGKTLTEWQKEQAGWRSREVEEVGGSTGRDPEAVQHDHDHEVVDGDEEMEDAFQRMVNSKAADQGAKQSENGNGRKIRATPVMSIYFARVPVPGLKELYGYVLNYLMDANY